MPVPTSINDLSTTAGSNSPPGTEAPTLTDDYLRVYASYIASLRDVVLSGTANLSTANLTYSGTLTGSTGVMNIGSGQVYKDASGKIGIGNASPSANLHVGSGAAATSTLLAGNNSGAGGGAAHIVTNAGSPVIGIGNYSALLGGAYSATPTFYFSGGLAYMDGATERMRIDISGNQINTPSNTPPTLTANGQMNLTPTSNTNLRISYRGSDGTTRVANITLA